MAIVGFFVFGLILGVVAISLSRKAKKAIETDPRLGGSGKATAAMVIGIIDIVAWGIIILTSL